MIVGDARRAGQLGLDVTRHTAFGEGEKMDRLIHHFPIALFCGALSACCMAGCQYEYDYEVRGTLKDCSGGSPLAGVRVTLGASALFVKPNRPVTGVDGRFLLQFSVSDGEFVSGEMPHWSLTLSKEGYADEVVDISPSREPESAQT